MGRLVEIEADAGKLSLRLDSFRSAWRLRHSAKSSLIPLLKAIHDQKLDFQVVVGSFVLKLLPKPTFASRMLVPELNRVIRRSRRSIRPTLGNR
jgi:hypothetical protein